MSVDITPIPPVVPGQTTVPEAIDSANVAFDRIRSVSILSNKNEVDIGDKTTLLTSNKMNLVSALNQVYSEFLDGFLLEKITGSLLNLTTTSKNNLVSAVNELDKEIGNLNALLTPTKVSLVQAINSIATASTAIGDMSILMTQDRFTLVGAINDVYRSVGFIGNLVTGDDNLISAVNKVHTSIGSLSDLVTTRKTNLVEAVNELKVRSDGFLKTDGTNSPTADMNFAGRKLRNVGLAVLDTDAVVRGQVPALAKTGDLTNLMTFARGNLVEAINELVIQSGTLTSLKTTDRSSLVNAINELYDNIGYSDKQVNLELLSTVNYGKGVGTNRNQTLNFFSSTDTGIDYNFRIQRMSGPNGHAVFDNRGTGMFHFGFGGTYRVRIQNDTTKPLAVMSGGSWKNVALEGEYLPTAGGIATGNITVKSGETVHGIRLVSGTVPNGGALEAIDPASAVKWSISQVAGPVVFDTKTAGLSVLGNLTVSGTIITPNDITGLSDSRLKTDVETITDGLNRILAMRGVSYRMDGKPGKGVIAQELELVDPDLVHTGEDGIKSVKYMQLSGYFIEAIRELAEENAELKNRLKRIEEKLGVI